MFNSIYTALQGMQYASKKLEVSARNVTGANQEGYARKQADYSTGPLGLKFEGIVRAEDINLSRELGKQNSTLAGLNVEIAARTALVDALGDPTKGNDLATVISNFSQSLKRLGDQPENATVQSEAAGRARDVVRMMSSLTETVQHQRQQADRGIGTAVGEVNGMLHSINTLNQRISELPAGADRTDLVDQREREIAKLMDYIPVRTIAREDDRVTVLTDTGVTLVNDEVHELNFTVAPAMEAKSSLSGGQLSGLSVDGINITPTAITKAPQAPRSGSLQALFVLRDQAMPQAQRQLDDLASVMTAAFQGADATITNSGTQGSLFLDGSSPHDRSNAVSIVGLAGRLTLNPLVDPSAGGEAWRMRDGANATVRGLPGDATQVRAYAAVFDNVQTFSPATFLNTQDSIQNWATDFISFQGSLRVAAEDKGKYQQTLVSALDSRVAARQGVDMDQEMQDVMLFERTYAASAQVFETASKMFDELLQRV
ncbi:flagellar hook-associated protein FlgK [Azospirillum sp. SYSU D00513]|uniref:flagellar hook-associated protein FlgK n=1 Tax=Azospirillum sp. SYSU D00513 TaxID=2812561 RepID=UPI001A973312|nr:flagellar hook-associated protein FlgK [Azospirillum sp. SYSU D00513]